MGNLEHGKSSHEDQVKQIMSYYRKYGPEWSERRTKFSKKRANAFFVGVMLDQMMPAERAWAAGEYLVENCFQGTDGFWHVISNTHLNSIKGICRTGYHGGAFALGVKSNSFPKNLKSAAKQIVDEYDSDVRNVWNGIDTKHVDEIYKRFIEFEGIGDALAKMAQFILVRDHGIAGGKKSKRYLSVKPDVHVRRVLFRLGISEKQTPASIVSNIDKLNLRSQADFDWAVWTIGRERCHAGEPECTGCPLGRVCEKHL